MSTRALPFFVVAASLVATVAVAWHGDYAWHDVAAPTAGASIKPGGEGIYGTGSRFEGGIQCQHCHKPLTVSPALDVAINFSPALTGGRYALGARYTITVDLLNETLLLADGGTGANNFAGMFEDVYGTPVGTLESDSGQAQGPGCPTNVPTTFAAGTTTLLYRDCHGVLSRSTAVDLKSWKFYWTAPSTNVGQITFWYGAVDGNANDRTMAKDGGPDDAVKMGSLILQP